MLSDVTKEGRFLSIDLDEWTARNKKRFINISVFSDQNFLVNLGLVHLTGSATSERYRIGDNKQTIFASSDAVRLGDS